MKKMVCVMILMMLFVWGNNASANMSLQDYQTVAENFLTYLKSDKKIIHTEQLKEGDLITGYVMELEKSGYILIPAEKTLPPIKAYSLNSNFDTLPDWYKKFLTDELIASQKIKEIRSNNTTNNNLSKWDFLLSYKERRDARQYTPDTFLIKTAWEQGYPYNKKLPQIDDKYALSGCVQVTQAQLMKYHQHPKKAEGIATHTWNGEELKAVLYKNYHWDNMPNIADSSTPEYMQDEIALLIRDLSIINKANYGLNSTSTASGTEGLQKYFGYATDMKSISNEDEELFFQTFRSEIDNERPVILVLPGHCTIADGYASDPTGKKIHVNMGYGGHYNDYYYLNDTIEVDSTVYEPDFDIIYNIRPCTSELGNCYSDLIKPESDDAINGNKITGKFDSADDTDRYEAYMKGTAQIEGTRGYTNQAFYIMIYNAKGELAVSSNEKIEKNLSAGKYIIEISLKSEGDSYAYDDKSIYTVNISTETLTASDYEAIENQDTAPVIQNDLRNIGIKAPYKIRIDTADEDGDEISLNAVSSDSDTSVSIADDVLTVTPLAGKGDSEITVKVSSNGKEMQKSFNVLITDILFGKEFTITGDFDNQEDFDKYKVILDGACTIKGDMGFSNQGFYISVLDMTENYFTNPSDKSIQVEYPTNLYLIGASLKQNPDGWGSSYPFDSENNTYTLFVNCPDADSDIDTIKALTDNDTGTYMISGYVRDGDNKGIDGVTLSYGNGNSVVTDASGAYSISLTQGWSGTVTPAKTGYTFTPSELTYDNLISDKSGENYVGIQKDYTISGYVKDGENNGIADVAINNGNGSSAITDSSGVYSISAAQGWSGTITPAKTGYTFTPSNRSYNDVKSNQTEQNYIGIQSTSYYSISGYIRDGENNGIAEVTLNYGNNNSVITDNSGAYSISPAQGWSGTVTPSKSGYTFTPSQSSYSNIDSNQTDQNYIGTAGSSDLLIWQTSKADAISLAKSEGKQILFLAGRETCGNCQQMRYTVCESASPAIKELIEENFIPWFCNVDSETDWYLYADGLDSFTLPLICCIDPDNPDNYIDRTVGIQTSEEFYTRLRNISEPTYYTISGYVRNSENNGIRDVIINYGNDKATTTDIYGAYLISVVQGWNGTITPDKADYTFTPSELLYENIVSNQTEQNYIGTANASDLLVWQTSKADAVALAKSEGKQILLVAGRETCGNCKYMRYTVCESASPAIKQLIEDNFILWFCDVDTNTDWYQYADGLGSFTLPLICLIDPDDPDKYLDRTTDIQSPEDFYARLLNSIPSLAGDTDHNGKVDLEDAILVLKVFAGINITNIHISADVNKDNRIGMENIIYILQKISGMRD